tara:strand:- start:86 stop:1018 length:933 start_codon:yes stop_codon:yes gene_type:complete
MISEVYDRDKRSVANILEDRKHNDYPPGFSNMPRNVFQNGYSGEVENELRPYNNKDYMPQLVSYVAHHYPHYEFWVTARTGPDEADAICRYVYVFLDDEPLGRIMVHDRYEGIFGFTNNRIRQDMNRGDTKKTGKLTAAKSIFRKYFNGMSMAETFASLAYDVKSAVGSGKWELSSKSKSAEDTVLKYFKEELNVSSAPLMQYLIDMGKQELIKAFHEAEENHLIAQKVTEAIDNRNGYYVWLKGDKYIKWTEGEHATTKHNRDEMPDDMRMALGLLRISEDSTFVDGAGFKLSDTKFFINNEVQLDFDS